MTKVQLGELRFRYLPVLWWPAATSGAPAGVFVPNGVEDVGGVVAVPARLPECDDCRRHGRRRLGRLREA